MDKCFFSVCLGLFITTTLGLAGFWGYFLYIQDTVPIDRFNFIALAGVISSASSICQPLAVRLLGNKHRGIKAIACLFCTCFSFALLLQVAISIVVLIYRQDHFLYKKSGECDDLFSSAIEVYNHSSDIMCTAYCPCNATNPEVLDYLNSIGYVQGSAKKITDCDPCENLGDDYGEYDNKTEQWFLDNLDGSVKQVCNSTLSFKEIFFNSKARHYLEFFNQIEEYYNCAGFCTNSKLHIFADINNGLPESNCVSAFINFFEDMFQTLGIPVIVFSFGQVIDI